MQQGQSETIEGERRGEGERGGGRERGRGRVRETEGQKGRCARGRGRCSEGSEGKEMEGMKQGMLAPEGWGGDSEGWLEWR